jgi:hypothetical protein
MINRIIVAKGDDRDYYYDASSLETWAQNSLSILTERFNKGYYFDPINNPNSDPIEAKKRQELEKLL